MAPVLLPRKVEMPNALSAEASNDFLPSSCGLDALVEVPTELVRVVTASVEASLEVESEDATVGKVEARSFPSVELSSFPTGVVVWGRAGVTVRSASVADRGIPDRSVMGVVKIK